MKRGKVGVIGLTGQSAFLTAEHFPRHGETISCSSLFFEPGGKGHNQAVACARMGVETVFVGAVGNDENGRECERALIREGIQACLVFKKESTAYAVITTIADGENTVEVYGGAAKAMHAKDLRDGMVRNRIRDCDYMLLQNELPIDCLEEAVNLAEETGIRIIFNPAPAENIPQKLFSKFAIVTPNYGEALKLAGYSAECQPSDEEISRHLLCMGIKNAVITLGREGVLMISHTECKRIPAYTHGSAVDTAGAGDTFNGVLVASLASGMSLEDAIAVAVTAAGVSVTRRGAAGSIPTQKEVMNCLIQ